MQRNVMISITGTQTDLEGNDASVELVTPGSYSLRKNEHVLEYEETDVSGMEGTHTRISVKGDVVSVTRQGDLNSRMQFHQGQKYISTLTTPLGALQLGIFPTLVDVDIQRGEGKVDLKYQLDVDGDVLGVNHLSVTFRKNEHAGAAR
nr:DUF1934 domain-containing protein [Maliibacterium massiliense]